MDEHHDRLHGYGLDEWVAAFDQVYRRANEARSIEGVLLHVVEHASQIQEDLRIGRIYNAITHLADAFCWTCAVVVKSAEAYGIEPSYQEQVIEKFPRCCYHCLVDQCICSATAGAAIEDQKKKDEAREANKRRRLALRERLRAQGEDPKSLYELQAMFEHIYSHVNFATPLDYIIAHFQEEVGEVAECINKLEDIRRRVDAVGEIDHAKYELWKHELELELADIFTWAMALLFKFDYMLGAARLYQLQTDAIHQPEVDLPPPRAFGGPQSIGLTLPRILWDRYGLPTAAPEAGLVLRCPRCQMTQCAEGPNHAK